MRLLFLFALVCLYAGTGSHAHTGDFYVARHADNITVDGKLDDWPQESWQEAAYYRALLAQPEDAVDFSAWFAVAWEDDRIYVAAKVRDDDHHNIPGIFSTEGDKVGFTIVPVHFRDTWNQRVNWSFSLSSEGDSVAVAPERPQGMVYLDHRVVRSQTTGETHYEGSIQMPENIAPGYVAGFTFGATDNDGGFKKGFYQSFRGSLTLPRVGGGDIVFIKGDADLVQVTGIVLGIVDGRGHAYVHAFRKDDLVGSALCDPSGAFSLSVPPGKITIAAFQGNYRSESIDIEGSERMTIHLDEKLGSITGRVTKGNGVAPVPLANVLALQNGDVKARTHADYNGHYILSGLDGGTYELICHVAWGDTIRDVAVVEGQSTRVRRFRGTEQTFDRQPWSDEVFEAARSMYAFDRDLPFDAELLEKREIAGYVREKIMLTSTPEERFPVYLALPKEGVGPYPCLLTLHAGSTIGKDRSDFELIRRRMTEIGYAVAALDAKYFNERHVNGKYHSSFGRHSRRDGNVQTVVDYRRLMDYLSTRVEIDTTRFGIYGGSMGTFHGTQLAGIDDRIKAYVMRGPGLRADQWDDEFNIADWLNYIPRFADMPIIIFSGYYDSPWAVQGTVRIVDMLRGPVEIAYYNTTHTVPSELYIDRMLSWLKENL